MPLNSLIKSSTTEAYQADDYWQYTEGYSYFRSDTQNELTESGKADTITTLIAMGFNATETAFYVASIFHSSFTGSGSLALGWYVQMDYMPKSDGSGWKLPSIIPVRNSGVVVPLGGMMVNVPPSSELITPPPEQREINIIGWNGGAVSVDSFIKFGHALFSIPANIEGVICGLAEIGLAKNDASYANIIYAIYAQSGQYLILINGNDSGIAFEAYTTADIFKIEIDDAQVKFFKNDVLKHTAMLLKADLTYVLDASLYKSKDSIENISITQNSEKIVTSWSDNDILIEIDTGIIAAAWVDDDAIEVFLAAKVFWLDEDSIYSIAPNIAISQFTDLDIIRIEADLIKPPSLVSIQFIDFDDVKNRNYPILVGENELEAVNLFFTESSLEAVNLYFTTVHLEAVVDCLVFATAELEAINGIAYFVTAELKAINEIPALAFTTATLEAVVDLSQKSDTVFVNIHENTLE